MLRGRWAASAGAPVAAPMLAAASACHGGVPVGRVLARVVPAVVVPVPMPELPASAALAMTSGSLNDERRSRLRRGSAEMLPVSMCLSVTPAHTSDRLAMPAWAIAGAAAAASPPLPPPAAAELGAAGVFTLATVDRRRWMVCSSSRLPWAKPSLANSQRSGSILRKPWQGADGRIHERI